MYQASGIERQQIMFTLQAELANRDFTAERGQVIVISNGSVASKDRVRDQQERLDAEKRNAYRWTL